MTNQETIQHCDHAEYDTRSGNLFGHPTKILICDKCGRKFSISEAMQEDAEANRPHLSR